MKLCFSAFTLIMTLTYSIADARTLYSINFDTHSQSNYFNFTAAGAPQIVGPIGSFISRSLAFNCSHYLNLPSYLKWQTFPYDQIEFKIDKRDSPFSGLGKASFKLIFDILTHGLIGSHNHFTILFDVPFSKHIPESVTHLRSNV